MAQLKSSIQLWTNHRFQQPLHASIHFTPQSGNPYDLLGEFNAYDWTLLSDDYLQQLAPSVDLAKLHRFFSLLGVRDFLLPVSDWTYEQFDCLIKRQSISMNKRVFLALQQTWRSTEDNERFIEHMRKSEWIPTVQYQYSYDDQTDQLDRNELSQLRRPTAVYIRTQQIEQLFEQHVPYLSIDVDSNSTFAHDLGLIDSVTASDVIAVLSQWCATSMFCSSISHLQSIYRYIYQNMDIDEVRNLASEKPIFFVPKSASADNTGIVRGRFVRRDDVCWCDPTNLFAKYASSMEAQLRYILEPYYSDQKAIFLDVFAVSPNPTVDEYLALLGKIIVRAFGG